MVTRKASIFKEILNTFGLFVTVPAFTGWLMGKWGYNEVYVFIITITLVWVLYTEFRIQDLSNKIKIRRKK